MKYTYNFNKQTGQFDVYEVESEQIVFRAKDIAQTKAKIKTLEAKGFQGFTPRFMVKAA